MALTPGQRRINRTLRKKARTICGQMIYAFTPYRRLSPEESQLELERDPSAVPIKPGPDGDPQLHIGIHDKPDLIRTINLPFHTALRAKIDSEEVLGLHHAAVITYLGALHMINEEITEQGRTPYSITFTGFLTKRHQIMDRQGVVDGSVLSRVSIQTLLIRADFALRFMEHAFNDDSAFIDSSVIESMFDDSDEAARVMNACDLRLSELLDRAEQLR